MKNLYDISELQYLLFDLEYDTIEATCSTILRSNYLENNEKQNILFANISLLIELRPSKINHIINLCTLLNKMDQSNFFSINLLKYLLDKLTQEYQYFIFAGYYNDLFPLELIISSIEYLIDGNQERKAYKISRWFAKNIYNTNTELFNRIKSFDFLTSAESKLLSKDKNIDFLLHCESSELNEEMLLYDILRRDDIERLQSSINDFKDILTKKSHIFSIESIYSLFVESSFLLDEKLTIFDVCAYYNSINCFEYLYELVESNNNSVKPKFKYSQSILQEKEKPFNVLHFAIAGGSVPIILFLIDHNFPIDNCLQCSIYFHRNDLIDYFATLYTNTNNNTTSLLNFSPQVWSSPLFQACHSNNVEILLQMIDYKDLQDNLSLPVPPLSSPSSPNPFFYNLNMYLQLYDNIIKAKNSIEQSENNKDKNFIFNFKNSNEADSALKMLFSSIKDIKDMLIQCLFILSKRGYADLLELFINEMAKISKLTENIMKERSNHDNDEFFLLPFDLNSVDKYDNTLLIIASKHNNLQCVQSLLNIEQIVNDLNESDEEYSINSIDVNLLNNEGRSALDYACFNCNYEIAEAILATGQVTIENIHKCIIACLRSHSFYNSQYSDEFEYKQGLFYLTFPLYIEEFSSYEKKFETNDLCFENILGLLLNSLKLVTKTSDDDKSQSPISFSMFHKTIEKYAIESDNLEVFKALMATPEALKSLSNRRCIEIIKNAIKFNSLNILKYIFTSSDSEKCPITVDKRINFLRDAIKMYKFDAAIFLYNLGIFKLEFEDVFSCIRYCEFVKLIYSHDPNMIISKINTKGRKEETLLTEAAKLKCVDSFKFIMNLPAVNINAKGCKYDPINQSYLSDCKSIFLMCVKHPTINMKLSSFVPEKAMEKVILGNDPIAAKIILSKCKNLDITKPYALDHAYSHPYNAQTSLVKAAYLVKSNHVYKYFQHYMKENNIEYADNAYSFKAFSNPVGQYKSAYDTFSQKPKVILVSPLEKSIEDNDIETFKKEINKDNINKHFEKTGKTPLTTAIQNGNVEMVKYLLSLPEIDVNLENDKSANNSYDFTSKKKAKISSFSHGGETPLITAINERNLEIVKLLLSMPKIDINKPSTDKSTPIIHAIKMRSNSWSLSYPYSDSKEENDKEEEKRISQEIIYAILENDDLDINIKGSYSSPLFEAIQSRQVDTIQRMMDLFAPNSENPDAKRKKIKLDLAQKNYLGSSPLKAAENYPEVKKILEKYFPEEEPQENNNSAFNFDLAKGSDFWKGADKNKNTSSNSSSFSSGSSSMGLNLSGNSNQNGNGLFQSSATNPTRWGEQSSLFYSLNPLIGNDKDANKKNDNNTNFFGQSAGSELPNPFRSGNFAQTPFTQNDNGNLFSGFSLNSNSYANNSTNNKWAPFSDPPKQNGWGITFDTSSLNQNMNKDKKS